MKMKQLKNFEDLKNEAILIEEMPVQGWDMDPPVRVFTRDGIIYHSNGDGKFYPIGTVLDGDYLVPDRTFVKQTIEEQSEAIEILSKIVKGTITVQPQNLTEMLQYNRAVYRDLLIGQFNVKERLDCLNQNIYNGLLELQKDVVCKLESMIDPCSKML